MAVFRKQSHAKASRRPKSGALLRAWAFLSMALLLLLILGLFGVVLYNGRERLSWSFLTEGPRGAVLGLEGGVAPAILGSLAFTGTALVLALPPALALALFIVFELKNPRLKRWLHGFIQVIAGIPSIVLGLFAYSLLVRELQLGRSVLAAAGGLSVMILPFIEQRAEKAFLEVPLSQLEASRALGCSRRYSLWHLVLPLCRGELVSAALLGSAYAMGATAPLIFTGAVAYAAAPGSLLEPAMALPLHLYLLLAQGPPSFPVAYATAAVMLILTLLLSLIATLYARRRHRWKRY